MIRNVIITADDYGMCESVNEGIDACLRAGTVHSTCVMVNMAASGGASGLRRRFPDCSIGIHWTLTEGRPILPARRVETLVNLSGEFLSKAEFRRRWLLGRIDRTELKSELAAQYARIVELVGAPEFWNTHQNIHLLPGLFQFCVDVGRSLAVPAMRCHRRITTQYGATSRYHGPRPVRWLKGELLSRWCRSAERAGVLMPDGRVYAPGGNGVLIAALEEILEGISWSRIRFGVEVVVHPARSIKGLSGSLTDSRVREYEILQDSSLVDRLMRRGVSLTGFSALCSSNSRREGVRET